MPGRRNFTIWILFFLLFLVSITILFMFILSLVYLKDPVRKKNFFYENGLNTTDVYVVLRHIPHIAFRLEEFDSCLTNDTELNCLKNSWSVPLQLEHVYVQFLNDIKLQPGFCRF